MKTQAGSRCQHWRAASRLLVVVVALFLISPEANAEKINGVEGLGKLRVDQVIFAGSHNAGAGYRGGLRYWSGIAAISGLYRNQETTFTEQLEAGIRYLDVDTMVVPAGNYGRWWGGTVEDRAWTGHSHAYAGPVADMVLQVRNWLNLKSNRNEVVVIHFSNNVREVDCWERIGSLIAKEFHAKLGPGYDHAAFLKRLDPPEGATPRQKQKTVGSSSERWSGAPVQLGVRGKGASWPTMKDVVDRNQRLFVFMQATKLYRRIDKSTKSGRWARLHFTETDSRSFSTASNSWTQVGNAYTPDRISDDADAKAVLMANAAQCDSGADFIRMSCVASRGHFLGRMAAMCAKHIREAAFAALGHRRKHKKTVNFLMVDRVGTGGEGSGENNLFEVVRLLNEANLRRDE